MLDFDKIEEWFPILGAVLKDIVPVHARLRLAEAHLRYVEDARDGLFAICDREEIVDRVLAWLQGSIIVGFHGTRLTDAELTSVQSRGLLRLNADERRTRLERALSSHPRWSKVAPRLDPVLRKHGAGAHAGRREGQVHLTLSRGALEQSFDHYLRYGSEFDLNVAHALLGPDGEKLLALDGIPRLVAVALPGEDALSACNRTFNVRETRQRGDIPSLVRELITSWAYYLACPATSLGQYRIDCGLAFYADIPPNWIINIETLSDPTVEQRT